MALSDIVDFFDKIKPITDVALPIAGAALASGATSDALKAQQAGADKSAEIIKQMYDQNRQDLAPYRAGGQAANTRLLQLMGISPEINRDAIKANIMQKHGAFFGGGQQQRAASATTGGTVAAAPINYNFGNQMTQGTTGNSFFDRLGMQGRIDAAMGKNGQVNPYTGEAVDAAKLNAALPLAVQGGRGLMGIQQASGQLMTDEQKAARDTVANQLRNAEYDPTTSLFDRLLPIAAMALATGGMGYGASLIQGPVAAGAVAPTTAANITKGAIQGAKLATGR